MRPILFELWGFPIASWYLFFALAALIGYATYYRNIIKLGDAQIERESPTLFVVIYLGGWVGARFVSILVEQPEVREPLRFVVELFSFGPMTFYGGALFGFVAGMVFVVAKKLPLARLSDFALPSAVLALGIGRIGCLLNGDDFGRAYADQQNPPWWTMVMPNLEDGLARYPVQLEEALASFVIATAGFYWLKKRYLNKEDKRAFREGEVGCYVVLLSVFNRFLNEFYRGDTRGDFLATSLSTSQGIALILITACLVVLAFIRQRTA